MQYDMYEKPAGELIPAVVSNSHEDHMESVFHLGLPYEADYHHG